MVTPSRAATFAKRKKAMGGGFMAREDMSRNDFGLRFGEQKIFMVMCQMVESHEKRW